MKVFRMLTWLLLGIVFYAVAYFMPEGYAQLQTIAYKAGHVTFGGYLGYFISDHAFAKEPPDQFRNLSMAIVMGAVIYAFSTGL